MAEIARIAALIVERPLCASCIASKLGLDERTVEAAIRGAIEWMRSRPAVRTGGAGNPTCR
jgi:hypothetical protein